VRVGGAAFDPERPSINTISPGLMLEAANKVSIVTVHAGNDGAAKFGEAIGFRPVQDQAWSHKAQIIAKS